MWLECIQLGADRKRSRVDTRAEDGASEEGRDSEQPEPALAGAARLSLTAVILPTGVFTAAYFTGALAPPVTACSRTLVATLISRVEWIILASIREQSWSL